ncbi:MAG: Kelch repeat-containing protein [Parvibaculaceae bacterium]
MRHLGGFVRFSALAGFLITSLFVVSPVQAAGWREAQHMITARANAGGALVGSDFYVIGGGSTAGPRSLTEVYDTIGNIWRAAAPLSVGLEQFGIATDGAHIFAAGGYASQSGDNNLGTESKGLWIYDVKTGSWASGKDMPSDRIGLSLAYVDGKVYAIGGKGYDASRIWVYDVAGDAWSVAKQSNPSPRVDAAVVVVGSEIYVIGGREGNNASARVDIYTPATGAWRQGPSLPSPREDHVAALVGDQIHVSGGQSISPPKSFSDHFVLDLKSKSWSKAAPMPTPRHGSVAAAVNGKFVVVGGAAGAGVYTVFTTSDVVDIFTAK